MTFIKREDLPVALRAAYDKAAKGVKNDETRINGKNDEKKIDSEKELGLFKTEVKVLFGAGKIDTYTYDSVNGKISSIQQEINKINQEKNSRVQNEAAKKEEARIKAKYADECKAKLAQYKKEHPIKYFIAQTGLYAESEYILLSEGSKGIIYGDYVIQTSVDPNKCDYNDEEKFKLSNLW